MNYMFIISIEILKALFTAFHDIFINLFLATLPPKLDPNILETWLNHTTPQKRRPLLLNNYRPIALANIVYKLCTRTLLALLTNFGEKHKILHFNQEGFRFHQMETQLATCCQMWLTLTRQCELLHSLPKRWGKKKTKKKHAERSHWIM